MSYLHSWSQRLKEKDQNGWKDPIKQTKSKSLLEATIRALIAAPTAIILNFIICGMLDQGIDSSIKAMFVIVSRFVFFLHSVIWKFVVHRIFNRGIFKKYGHVIDLKRVPIWYPYQKAEPPSQMRHGCTGWETLIENVSSNLHIVYWVY